MRKKGVFKIACYTRPNRIDCIECHYACGQKVLGHEKKGLAFTDEGLVWREKGAVFHVGIGRG